MTGAAVALALLALGFGPNDHLLAEGVRRADALELRLVPWATLVEGAGPLWVAAAEEGARRLAPGFSGVTYLDPQAFSHLDGVVGSRIERWLPGWRVPRLVMSAEGYFSEPRSSPMHWRLVGLEGLAVDQVDALLRALLEARFAPWLADRGGDSSASPLTEKEALLVAHARERAESLFDDVPEGQRAEVYIATLAELGAVTLAIRHEIGRHARRRGGTALCSILGHPATLFGHWKRTFEGASFRGTFRAPDSDPMDRGSWRFTAKSLQRQDKDWLFSEVLGFPVSGDPERDFSLFCEGSASGPGP